MTTTIKVKNEMGTIHGLSSEEISEGLEKSWKYGTDVADMKFVYVNSGQDITLRTATIYRGINSQGLHEHARGKRSGNVLTLHSGFIPHELGNRDTNEDYYFKPFSRPESLGSVMFHEFLHREGRGHVSNPSYLMHQNASAPELCGDEAQFLINRYGSAQGGSPVDPVIEDSPFNPDGTLKRGTVIENVNLPEISNGSYVIDGKRYWLKGQRLVGVKFQVFINEFVEDNCCTFTP